jgi:hypothetical protein
MGPDRLRGFDHVKHADRVFRTHIGSLRCDDLATEVRAKILCRAQIDAPSAKQRRYLDLDPRQPQQARFAARLEFHQQIDVAVPPRRAFQHRSEQRQTADMVLPAEPEAVWDRCNTGAKGGRRLGG